MAQKWVAQYDAPDFGDDRATAIAVTDSDGNLVVTGYTTIGNDEDFFTAKYAADGRLLWSRSYYALGSDKNDRARALAVGSGGIAVTGSSYNSNGNSDYATVKYDSEGRRLWEKRYNGTGSGEDFPNAVGVDTSGNVVVTGYSLNANGNFDYYTAKYAASNGALLWEKRYNGTGANTDQANAVALDASSNVIVTGHSVGSTGTSDYYTAKYASADGTLLWEKRYNGTGNSSDFSKAVAIDTAGNVIVTGQSTGSGSGFDYYTAKYAASNGALLWEKRYNGPGNSSDVARDLALDGSGNVVVTGYSFQAGSSNSDYYTAKYSSTNGALLWERRYVSGSGTASAVSVASNGDVAVTGTSSLAGSDNDDYYTARYAAANGTLLWERRDTGVGYNDGALALATDTSGNILVTGYSEGVGGTEDYYTAKYAAADGAVLWGQRYNPTSAPRADADSGPERPKAVAFDGNGDVIITATWPESTGYTDILTVKYSSNGGEILWQARYNGPGQRDDHAAALAIDSSGNVAVTGYSTDAAGLTDFYTAKYLGTTGALLWQKSFNGPALGYDSATAIAVDSAGNVIVTGTSTNSSGNQDLYTAKYASANGGLIWERSYNGPNNGEDVAVAVVVDSAGNAIVTGYSDSASGGADYYTAKYAAANGALLWERRYNGPSSDIPKSVAVDSGGNAIVTGASFNPQGDQDYYTAKYFAADGSILWEKRYDAGGGSDFAATVRVDSNGDVVVTGTSAGTQGFDFYTAKYAGTTGGLLWERRGVPADGGSLSKVALTLDASGNAVIASDVLNSLSGNIDYYTAKYAAGNGALLWEQRFDGGFFANDAAGAVAVDRGGNVAVTGVLSDGTYLHLATVYYIPAVGAPIITVEPPTDVADASAKLNATVNPGGLPTQVRFYLNGTVVGVVDVAAGDLPVTVSFTATGLARAGSYSYSASASNAKGVSDGASLSFTAAGDPFAIGLTYVAYPPESRTPSVISFFDDAGRFGGTMIFARNINGKIVYLKRLVLFGRSSIDGTTQFYEFSFLSSGKLSKIFSSDGTIINLVWTSNGKVKISGFIPGIGQFSKKTSERVAEAADIALQSVSSVKLLNGEDFSTQSPSPSLSPASSLQAALEAAPGGSKATSANKALLSVGQSVEIASIVIGAAAVGTEAAVAAAIGKLFVKATVIGCEKAESHSELCQMAEAGDAILTITEIRTLTKSLGKVRTRHLLWLKNHVDELSELAGSAMHFIEQLFGEENPAATVPDELHLLGDTVSFSGGPEQHVTAWFSPEASFASVTLTFNFYDVPDTIKVLTDSGEILFDPGPRSGTGSVILPAKPAYYIIVNQSGSSVPTTEWNYSFGVSPP